ncbi:MAG: DUF3833 family protein [Pseudomonadota bacterium]
MRPFLLLIIATLGGCATSLNGERYADQVPAFDLFDFFDGDVQAWGIVQNRSGEVTQRFQVAIEGKVIGDELRLEETFTYLQGEGIENRVWTIERNGDGTYSGGASDFSDKAEGTSYGNAFRWTYSMSLPVGNRTYDVKFDDWIFALGEDQILNRSYIQKFGLDVAAVTLFMTRQ